ncbi:MAG: hypothetical protein OXC41_09840 [Gammaproteobacteria bacterium]|nr:hypothetical protein [Gammaproteobacteria bacterium]
MPYKTTFSLCLVMGFLLSAGCTVTPPESGPELSASPPLAPLDGIWKGEFDIGGRGPFDFTAVHIDGKAYAYSERAKAMCVGTVELDGENYTSTYALFVLDGGPFDLAKLTGKATEQNEIASHFATMNGGDTGALNLEYDAVYNTPSSLEMVTGAWSYTDQDNLTTQFDIGTEGVIQGRDSDHCQYQGQVGIINPDYNAYRIAVEISGCSSVNGAYEGVSFLAEDRLSVQIANARYALFFAFDRDP